MKRATKCAQAQIAHVKLSGVQKSAIGGPKVCWFCALGGDVLFAKRSFAVGRRYTPMLGYATTPLLGWTPSFPDSKRVPAGLQTLSEKKKTGVYVMKRKKLKCDERYEYSMPKPENAVAPTRSPEALSYLLFPFFRE